MVRVLFGFCENTFCRTHPQPRHRPSQPTYLLVGLVPELDELAVGTLIHNLHVAVTGVGHSEPGGRGLLRLHHHPLAFAGAAAGGSGAGARAAGGGGAGGGDLGQRAARRQVEAASHAHSQRPPVTTQGHR